jgi:regulator of sigma E protease
VTALAQMVRGQREADLRGPLGISDLSREAGERGVESFLRFMAILSINLGILNLLPVPALDGGRLLFVGAEAVRGRRVEPSREAVVHLIGFVLVLGLMAVLTVMEFADKLGPLVR